MPRRATCTILAVLVFLAPLHASAQQQEGVIVEIGDDGVIVIAIDHYGAGKKGHTFERKRLKIVDNAVFVLDGRIVPRDIALRAGRRFYAQGSSKGCSVVAALSERATDVVGTIAAVGIGNGGNDRGNLYFGENSFQSFRTGNGPIDVLIDDLDGDGRPELVTASFRSSSLEILSPAGGSLPPTLNTSTAQLVSIASGDLNGDERVDLVAGGYGYDPGGTNIVGFETDSQINVLLNEGDGEFTLLESNDSTLRGRFVAIEVSDLDGNGVAEILAISRVGESDSVLNVYRVNDQSLQRISSIPVTPKASAMDDGDLNGDGLADVVITSESEGTVAFYLGDGQGVFQQIQLIDNIPVPIDLTLVDLESDNRAEVAVVNQFKGFNGSMPTPGSTVTLLRLQVAEQVVLVGQDPVTADFSFPSAVLRPRMDVNADRSITVLDALRVINAIGEPPLPASSAGEGEAVSRLWRATDVDLDGATTARDALLIINQLARQTHDEVVAGSSFVSSNDDDDNDRYHDAVDEVMAGKLF